MSVEWWRASRVCILCNTVARLRHPLALGPSTNVLVSTRQGAAPSLYWGSSRSSRPAQTPKMERAFGGHEANKMNSPMVWDDNHQPFEEMQPTLRGRCTVSTILVISYNVVPGDPSLVARWSRREEAGAQLQSSPHSSSRRVASRRRAAGTINLVLPPTLSPWSV